MHPGCSEQKEGKKRAWSRGSERKKVKEKGGTLRPGCSERKGQNREQQRRV
jgi:hypothetical protein